MVGGREKLAAKAEVTSAASGSRNFEMEAERRSAEGALAIKEVSLFKERSKHGEEVAAGKDVQALERKGSVICVESASATMKDD